MPTKQGRVPGFINKVLVLTHFDPTRRIKVADGRIICALPYIP
jgi:hypothetical protein